MRAFWRRVRVRLNTERKGIHITPPSVPPLPPPPPPINKRGRLPTADIGRTKSAPQKPSAQQTRDIKTAYSKNLVRSCFFEATTACVDKIDWQTHLKAIFTHLENPWVFGYLQGSMLS
jgi:hypothetical protein